MSPTATASRFLAHFPLVQSSCLRTEAIPKHLTPAKMRDFTVYGFKGKHPRGCSPVGSVPNSWHVRFRLICSWNRLLRSSAGGRFPAFACGIEVWGALFPVAQPL